MDLFTGMLAENPLPDGLLGPTASCIIADQFVRLKRGDRFWYETPDPDLRFTPGKLLVKISPFLLINQLIKTGRRSIGFYSRGDYSQIVV